MGIDKNKVKEEIIEAVVKVQEMSARTTEGIGSSTKPIGGLEGFDSLNGIEVTVILSESLSYSKLPAENLFVSEDGRRALSVAEIADRICEIIEKNTDNK